MIIEILEGLQNVGIIFFMTLLVSIPLASLAALVYESDYKILKKLISTYTWIVRGTPLMLQLTFAMFGLPVLLSIPFRNRLLVASTTFILNYTGYFIEIFRNGLAIIPKSQWEAATLLQISKPKTMLKIIYPQMFRNTLRTLENEAVTLLKDTALISTIALSDILRNAKEILNRELTITPLIIVFGMYLLFSYLIIQVFKVIQRKVRLS